MPLAITQLGEKKGSRVLRGTLLRDQWHRFSEWCPPLASSATIGERVANNAGCRRFSSKGTVDLAPSVSEQPDDSMTAKSLPPLCLLPSGMVCRSFAGHTGSCDLEQREVDIGKVFADGRDLKSV